MDDLKLIVTNRFNSLNYSELNNYKESIIDYILVQEDPLAYLSFLEDIFIKNYTFDAIKTFVLFQMLYNSNKTIDSNKLYKCLIKINLDSNNQSIREFIVLIKLGYQLFKKIINKEVSFDTLNNKQQRCLSIFVSQLTHIYNLSVDAVQNHLSLTGSIEHDILLLSSLSEKISLEDVIIQQMFPFSTMSELQNYLDNLRTTVNNNGQLNASRSFGTMSNVLFLSKRCDLKTFGAILTSGLLASQFTNHNLNSPS